MEAFKKFKESGVAPDKAPAPAAAPREKWVCKICGYVYDGDVPFEQLPKDWKCPDAPTRKATLNCCNTNLPFYLH